MEPYSSRLDVCYDELASCPALIKVGGIDCTTSGAQEFCAKSCKVCGNAPRKRSADECSDELATCSALVGNGGMDCTTSGAQEFCAKSCNACEAVRRKRSGDDTVTIDSDNCYDELASCSALIANGGMDCTKAGAKEMCRKSCDSCLN